MAEACDPVPHTGEEQRPELSGGHFQGQRVRVHLALLPPIDPRSAQAHGGCAKVWNPKTNYKDAAHILPVITPAFPAINSMAYTSDSTLRAIKVTR